MSKRRWQWVCITIVAAPYVWSLYLPAAPAWMGFSSRGGYGLACSS